MLCFPQDWYIAGSLHVIIHLVRTLTTIQSGFIADQFYPSRDLVVDDSSLYLSSS